MFVIHLSLCLCIERAPMPACLTNDVKFVLNLSSRELPLKW